MPTKLDLSYESYLSFSTRFKAISFFKLLIFKLVLIVFDQVIFHFFF